MHIPWWLRWKRICLQWGRPGFHLWVRKIPWRREQLPTQVFLPREFHGQRSLVDYSPCSHKESDPTEWLSLSLFFIYIYVYVCTYIYTHTYKYIYKKTHIYTTLFSFGLSLLTDKLEYVCVCMYIYILIHILQRLFHLHKLAQNRGWAQNITPRRPLSSKEAEEEKSGLAHSISSPQLRIIKLVF